jgi:hypothetical protein
MAALIAVGLLCWLAAHYPLWSTWAAQVSLDAKGICADATLLNKSVTKGRFADIFNLRYRLDLANGKRVIHETVSREIYDHAIEGYGLTVRYDPANPGDAMIVGNGQIGRLLWIYGVINALLLLAAFSIRRSVSQEMVLDREVSD